LIAQGLTATQSSDQVPAQGTTYYYVASGVNTNGEGADSAAASVTLLLPPPVVHLRFDESSGSSAADSSGNGWSGTLVNGPVWISGAASKINNAVNLDGTNDQVTFAQGIVSGTNDVTFAAWVKWNGGNDWQRIFDFGTGTSNYLFLSPRTNTGMARFAIRTAAVAEQQISGGTIPTGVWTHVAVTISGSTGTLYLNGVAVGTNPAMTLKPSSLGNTTQNYLGKSQFAADPAFNGGVDEFQIHNRALAAGEIAALAAPPAAPSGLAATSGDARVDLTWNPVAGAAGYLVKRAGTSDGPFVALAAQIAGTTFGDVTVTNGTSYYYAVTAVVSVAESARSAPVTATPLSPLQVWRLANFGTIADSGDAADAADPDADGTPNATEFRLGLAPNDGASAFRASGMQTGEGFQITWPSAEGATFEVRRSSDLDGPWELVGTVIGAGVFTDPEPLAGRGFYRVELLP
jgi:hypothetical protein